MRTAITLMSFRVLDDVATERVRSYFTVNALYKLLI